MTGTLTLDFEGATRPLSRTTDPETSHEAAASVRDLTERQEAVLNVLRECGPMTDEDLVNTYSKPGLRYAPGMGVYWANSAGIEQSESGIRTRRSELVALGKVRHAKDADGKERYSTTASGRRSRVWEVVP